MDIAARRRQAFLDWMEANGLNAHAVAKKSGVKYNTLNTYEVGDTQSLKGDNEAKIASAYDLPVEAIFGFGEELTEDLRQPNHLKAWREHRKLSIEAAARLVGTTPAVVDLLERGGATLSLKWLYKFGDAFGVKAGRIADGPPVDGPDVWEIIQGLTTSQQQQLVEFGKVMQRTGTGG